ncbi:F-box protein CPR1-like [Juglans regia]|uniref:F-box protein CPR1-like n=1 Tax=Juglans regia TaxID=51240 RepID=A0A6P9ENU5_JUGRE|nr:F-box protein CPR1-like [Juglans regia]
MPYVLCYTKKNGTLASGCLHWVVNRKFKFDDSDLIVAFDLTVESFREVPMPKCAVEKFQIDVGVLGRCFCMVANYYDIRVDVWVMKEYGVKESWAKLFTVEQEVIFFCGTFTYLRPLAYSKSGEEVLLEQNHERLLWYDLRKKKIKNVNLGGLPTPFEAHICVGSLVSAEVNREYNEKQHNSGAEKIKSKKRDDFLSKGFKLVL